MTSFIGSPAGTWPRSSPDTRCRPPPWFTRFTLGWLTSRTSTGRTEPISTRFQRASCAAFSWISRGREIIKNEGVNSVQELSGATVTANLLTGGVDEVFQRTDSAGARSFLVNALGSTRVIFRSDNQSVCFDSDYTPFGYEVQAMSPTCPQNYKYAGYERDAETGLDYAIMRYYNNKTGRFMTADMFSGSISHPQSDNRYSYGFNNPCTLSDPLGLDPACKISITINFDPIYLASKAAQNAAMATIRGIFNNIGVTASFVSSGNVDYTVNVSSQAILATYSSWNPEAYGATALSPNGKQIANFGAVFMDQLQSAADKYNVASAGLTGRGVGRVASHEFGHYLLNNIRNDAFIGSNIMSEHYDSNLFFGKSSSSEWNFSSIQGDIIRAKLGCPVAKPKAPPKNNGGSGGGGGNQGGLDGINIPGVTIEGCSNEGCWSTFSWEMMPGWWVPMIQRK